MFQLKQQKHHALINLNHTINISYFKYALNNKVGIIKSYSLSPFSPVDQAKYLSRILKVNRKIDFIDFMNCKHIILYEFNYYQMIMANFYVKLIKY